MINDIKPPKPKSLKVEAKREEPLDIDSGEIKISHMQSTDEAIKSQVDTSFFKNTDDNLNGYEEDGSTTLSSSSPI